MSTTIDQKAYLQKYLGKPSGDKKKKKKKAPKGKGFKIIDDDIDLTKLRPLDGDELDILDEGEDGPQVAGIIDERPEEIRKLEQFKTSSKWRVVTQDDGFNSKLNIQEIKKDITETEKENELVFGKMYSDSEDDQKKDSDVSPPRIRPNEKNNKETKKKKQNSSDNDFSPPRKRDKGRDSDASPSRKKSDNHKNRRYSDASPPRKNKHNKSDSDVSPPRKGRESPNRSRSNKNYDSDLSPPRKAEVDGKNKVRARKPSRWGAPEEPQRRYNSESPERNKKRKDSRRSRKDSSDSDCSPPRKSKKDKYQERQPKTKSRRDQSSESDLSPPRKRKTSQDRSREDERYRKDKQKSRDLKREKVQISRRQSSDSDVSPPRKNKRRSASPETSKNHKRQRDSSSDLSPPRKDRREPNKERGYRRNDDDPPPTNKKMERTLEGKLAGLQDARQLREENESFRRREEDAFKKMTDDVSGRNAQVVSRKAKRETSEERQKLKEKAERQKFLDEKYKQWSKGLKQIEAETARREDFIKEAAKPLARMKGDRDLERSLKEIERDGDPMLAYIRDKKRERGDLGPEKPTYKGSFPPNRFNIRPGYRWDGVDRSNGYEKKFFENQSKRKAQEEEAYKWSTEDL
ncbi:BUD13 homolog [Ostrinia nubilalis]|uniref:BUD13 homolog n=1 Tax=Ostrinia nubilalis TaxID=29057 RepID=UPI00308246BA